MDAHSNSMYRGSSEPMDMDEHEHTQTNSGTTAEHLSQASATDDVSKRSAEIERLTQELEQTRAKNDHLQNELDRLADEMRTESTKKEALSIELEQSGKSAGQMQTELNRAHDEVNAKSVAIEELKKELGQLSETSAHDLAEATAKIMRQTEEIIQLQNDDAKQKTLEAYSARLEKELKETKQSLEISVNDVADLEECLQREIANYKSTLEEYRTEIHSQTETIRLIQDESIVLSRSLPRLHKEVARLNTDKAQLFSKNDGLQNQLQLKEDELSKEKRKHNKNKPEINSLKKEIHSHKETLDKERKQWNAEKAKLEQMCNVAKEETNRFRHGYETVTKEYNAVKETLKKTSEERNELTMRLSKLASASLTHNNPNIADLSDPNRPTKLAEIFSELYDNEWTDAFEKLKEDDERTTVDRLLTILQKAYEYSVTLTDQASNDMGGKLTSLSLKHNKGSKVQALHKGASRHAGERHEDTTELRDPPEQRIEYKSAANSSPEYSENVKSDCDTIGEKERSVSLTVGCSELKTKVKLHVDPHHHELTAEHGFAGVESNTDMSELEVCAQYDQVHAKGTIPLCKDIAIQAGSPEEMDVSTLSLDFNILSPTEKQTINDIRKRVLHELKDQIIPVIANAVVGEMNFHACDDSIITYVKACASVCWEMRIHQPPVCLEFLEIDDQTPFNTATYKHYTKNGRRIDYIVWPAMYLCKGGSLLNKGVAQGN